MEKSEWLIVDAWEEHSKPKPSSTVSKDKLSFQVPIKLLR